MSQNQSPTQSKTVDSTILKDLTSLAQPSRELNPSAFVGDGMIPYISDVGRIRILREHFKEETKSFIDLNIREVENEKVAKLQTANKVQLLVNYNKSVLQEMDKQRSANGAIIGEIVKMSKSLLKNHDAEEKTELLQLTNASIKTLLSELNQ